jgi:uncharacterized membrane protein (UPF0127 family)
MSPPLRLPARLGALLLTLLAATACAAGPETTEVFEYLQQADVTILSGDKSHQFRVWIADTPPRRSRGLMFIRELAPDHGMLFLFDFPQFAYFWMQNTYVSLDLLFIAPDGRIVNIAEHTTPLSTRLIESEAPVVAVLEVIAGTAGRLGLRAGDRVLQPAFTGAGEQ